MLFAAGQQAAIAHEISHIQEHTQKTQSHKSDLSSCTQCIGFAKLQHINDSEFVFNLEELKFPLKKLILVGTFPLSGYLRSTGTSPTFNPNCDARTDKNASNS